MPLNGRICFTLIMLSIFATMIGIALGYPPPARFLPLVIGIPGIVLTVSQLVVDLRELRQPPPVRDASEERDAHQSSRTGSVLKREIVLFAYFFALVAGVILFGFWLTIPVFIIVFLGLHERESWRFAMSLTIAGTAALYLVFDRMLSIILHEGFITAAAREWLAQ